MHCEAEVEVLLATYNGARYLRDQIDSILGQDYPNLRVLARDDGSEDGTAAILNQYQAQLPGRFQVLPPTTATGSAKGNFLLLLRASKGEYVCFADQDDVWLPDKVSSTKRCMDALESRWGKELPLLVFTDLRVVDEDLKTLEPSFWRHEKLDPSRIHRFGALLGQNVVTGCTAILNRRLVELARRMPAEAYMHDQWVALVAAGMGKAMPMEGQTVLYRQHDQNVVGFRQRARSIEDLLRQVRNGKARRYQWSVSQRQAESFLNTYQSELPAESLKLLAAYLRWGKTRSRMLGSYLSIRYGFLRTGILEKLATLADQWTLKPGE